MDLREALTQIHVIREQVAQTQTFRGYRATPVAFTGLVALATAVCQSATLSNPADAPVQYLMLWSGAALLSQLMVGAFILLHYWRSDSSLARSNTLLTVGQFFPSIFAGAVLTSVVFKYAPEALWMLPGLWSMLFSLGVFASYRLLPSATFWVGVYYLLAGAACLVFAQGEYALSPWAMAGSFGVGQFLSAAVLYWTLERQDVEPQL